MGVEVKEETQEVPRLSIHRALGASRATAKEKTTVTLGLVVRKAAWFSLKQMVLLVVQSVLLER